jgi:hypothetical protein
MDNRRARVRRFLLATSMVVAVAWPAPGQSNRGAAAAGVAPVPCAVDARSTSAATLWEQARSGFRAIVGTPGAPAPPRLQILRYAGTSTFPRSGETDPAKVKRPAAAELVLTPTIFGIESFSSTLPWADVRSARELETRGYVVAAWTGLEVFQPVPEVLLDSTFVRSHCFTLAEPRADRAGQVGVAFRPAPARAALGDVEGVLWMSGSPSALIALEYRYVGPAPVIAERIEGRMTFRTAANGAVVVDGWSLSAARTVTPVFPTYADLGTQGGGAAARSDGSNAFRRTLGGGASPRQSRVDTLWRSALVVLSAAWPDRTAIQRTLPTLTGRVVEAATSAPLAGQAIRLSQLRIATSGTGGEFTTGPMPAGRFTVTAADTALDLFGLPRSVSATFAVDTSAIAPLTLRMPSAYDAARAACTKTLRGGGKGIVAFRAVDSTGATRDISMVTVTVMSPTGGRQVVDLSRTFRSAGRRPPMILCGVGAGTVVADAFLGYGYRGEDFVQVTGTAVFDTLTVLVRGGR